ncbi:polysaccharide ABC transporter ATP-binding protein [Bradyrhizobium sp. BWA-3-5]|uniref:ABC transporter ATP-binding protein n=1 Tax=Bradyrhizobium sp. BWA-3-5 TaxID=3080013 RepID=UPI00293E2C89|nr:polysaccharide ABC transporter ATP-binding protein [Bradyrhizobium sp. BWA-3-5]WOH68181.1 polysaccharide ABC transporter ATP-binding protein [Bradyrhizobium sp. BWA-3-5]
MGVNERPAIVFEAVTKRYRLGGGTREKLLDAFGLSRFVSEKKAPQDFLALDDVSFQLDRGRRMGLIGRNGAGKTTLLKLISGNFRPSSGHVEVNGSVQALMTMGQGFHPDYTGRENIEASLHYNGLSSHEVDEAFEDVVEFCELGPFLDQPFKTYSSGMQSRLMFATATAIRPDILIIDEVLGAGDAYFLAKSKHRVDRIVENGCTLLLVSHSMQQVLELCDEAIWLDGGRINLAGEAFNVVKAYEEGLYGAMPGSGDPLATRRRAGLQTAPVSQPKKSVADAAPLATGVSVASDKREELQVESGSSRVRRIQIPRFLPHEKDVNIPTIPDEDGRTFHNTTRDGVSRWKGVKGTKIVGFGISGPTGLTDRLISLQPAQLTVFLESETEGHVAYTYGVAIYDLHGRPMCRFFSPPDCFEAQVGAGRRVNLVLNPNQLGPGVYVISISIHGATTIEGANAAPRYDLLNRSFEITVELPNSLAAAGAEFFHSCEWNFEIAALPSSSVD